jgi:RNA polymerase sigma-70 factor (ECF subfamily)
MHPEMTFTDISRARAIDDAGVECAMDEETFRGLYERTARGLWAYLFRVTGDRQLADDLVQETFYRFLRASATLETEAHRKNSLYRIATNLARDARRRSLTRLAFGVAAEDIEHVASGQDAGTTERVTDVTRAMARLNPRERAMLWLAYAEGASHREIATVLGLSVASLKPMLSRVRHKLAALLDPPKGGKS